jgi:hypothetical protein
VSARFVSARFVSARFVSAYSVVAVGPVREHGRHERSLTDGVVLIRPLAVSDAVVHFAAEDDEIVRWLTGGRSTREATAPSSPARWADDGPQFVFGIRVRAGDHLVGTIDARTVETYLAPGQVNIAYAVYPQW